MKYHSLYFILLLSIYLLWKIEGSNLEREEFSIKQNSKFSYNLPSTCQSKCINGQIGFLTENNKKCISWGISKYYNPENYLFMNTTFCEYYSNYWYCITGVNKDEWDYCKEEDCKDIETERECLEAMNLATTSTSIHLNLTSLCQDKNCIVVLYTQTYKCIQASLCQKKTCENFHTFVTSFFKNCQVINNVYTEISEYLLSPLTENTLYKIYIIQVLNSEAIGSVFRMNVKTQPSKLLIPGTIKLISRTSTSIKLKWNSTNDLKLDSKIYRFDVELLNNGKKSNIIGSDILQKLESCKIYCFRLNAYYYLEKYHTSESCFYTSPADNIDKLEVYNNTVKWFYNNSNKCSVIFEGEYYKKNSNGSIFTFKTDKNVIILNNLESQVLYLVRIRISMKIEQQNTYYGPFTDLVEFSSVLIHKKLDKPTNITLIRKTTQSLSFIWYKPKDSETKGPPHYYNVTLSKSNKIIENKRCTNESTEFNNLKMCMEYCLQLYAINKAGNSEKSQIECQRTLAPSPGVVKVNNIESGPSLERVLSWKYSENNDCPIFYKIKYIKKYLNHEEVKETNLTSIKIENLQSNIIYIVQVRASTNVESENNKKDVLNSEEKEFFTGTVKPNINEYNEVMPFDSNTLTQKLNISWIFNTFSDGSVFEFIILLKNFSDYCLESISFICSDCPEPYKMTNLKENDTKKRESLLNCMRNKTMEVSGRQNIFQNIFIIERTFTNLSVEIYAINLVGIHNVYRNKSLYKKENIKYNNHTNESSVWSLCISLVAITVITLVVMMVLYKFRIILFNKYNEIKMHSNRIKSIPLQESLPTTVSENLLILEQKHINTAISLKNFPKYCQKMSENKNEKIILEFKKLNAECKRIEKDLGLTVIIGKLKENSKRNRFTNIIPFDQTRVILQNNTSVHDYINANYIPFINDEDNYEYIASQGPLQETVDDFWEMISEENITYIIMLTRTIEEEKFKCLQYWPEHVGEELKLGQKKVITIKLEEEKELESHFERVLLMKNKINLNERKIIQLHMHTWYDYSAPNLEYFDKLLFRFHEIVNNAASNPYLIHCSAGVGRTGTLICIDRIIKQLVNGDMEINIYDTVLRLRRYRSYMVQRQAQYIFIHEYLNHFLEKYMNVEAKEEPLYANED